MTTREDILRVARSLVGTKYRHGGRSRHSVDCAGLLVVIAQELGIPHTDAPVGYSRKPDGSLMKYLRENMVEVPIEEAQPGDVNVYFLDSATKEPQHVGIRTENGGLIHALMHYRRVVETSRDPYWDRRLLYVFRARGIA